MEFSKIFKDKKKANLLIILGIAVMILIFLTCLIPKDKKKTEIQPLTQVQTRETYLKELTQTIENMVKKIDGVGNASVTITLKNGIEQVFAKDEVGNVDNNASSCKEEYEKKTILVEDETGQKTALIAKTLEPTVNGVCVICDGGNDFDVQQRVIFAVKTALNIGANKVYVTK